MKKNGTLYKAYLLKEQILDIMDEPIEKKAYRRFAKWLDNIATAKIPEFDKVARMLERYSYGIVSYFKHKVTNAASEGFNTKINVIKRRAYGFRDMEYFMLKIIQLCGISSRNPWRANFIKGVIEKFEAFLQQESQLPDEQRLLSKDEALRVTDNIYQYIQRYIAFRNRKSPEELENEEPDRHFGGVTKKDLKRMADEEREKIKLLKECLKNLEKFAKEIESKY
jgi:hypothetical protein